jgi:hypothetical protein
MYPISDIVLSLHTEGRDYQLKQTKPVHDTHQSFYPTSMTMGGQYFATYQSILIPPWDPAQHAPRPPVATLGGYRYWASDPGVEVLR